MDNLSSSHWVVAGASQRIGLLLARRLLEQGARVSALFRTKSSELKILQDDFPNQCAPFAFDLRKIHDFTALVHAIVTQQGAPSGLLLVASDFYRTPLGSITETDWDNLFDTNVKGHAFLAQAFTPALKKPAQLITLVDIFAEKPLRGYLPYAAAKAAFLSVSRNLALELSPEIRVNSISPGPVLLPEHFSEEEKELHASRTLLGRVGSAEDIWEAVRFLAGQSYLTGVNLRIDGGASLL